MPLPMSVRTIVGCNCAGCKKLAGAVITFGDGPDAWEFSVLCADCARKLSHKLTQWLRQKEADDGDGG